MLVRVLRWPATQVADQLDDLVIVCGSPITLTSGWARQAAGLAEEHGLTFYDAAWAAVARDLDVPLVSADSELLRAGLAVTPPQSSSDWDWTPALESTGSGRLRSLARWGYAHPGRR